MWYLKMKPVYDAVDTPYEKQRLHLLFTDTDSLCFHVTTDDFAGDVRKMGTEYFDTSSLHKNHPLYSKENAGKLGCYKFESGTNTITEFVGLKSKVYSYIQEPFEYSPEGVLIAGEGSKKRSSVAEEKKAAKGISKATVKNMSFHDTYVRALYDAIPPEERKVSMTRLGHKNNEIFLYRQMKEGLNNYDDKRFLLKDGITSLPYGHCRIGVEAS